MGSVSLVRFFFIWCMYVCVCDFFFLVFQNGCVMYSMVCSKSIDRAVTQKEETEGVGEKRKERGKRREGREGVYVDSLSFSLSLFRFSIDLFR